MGTRTESRTQVRRPLLKAKWAMMRPWAGEIGIEAVLDTIKGKGGAFGSGRGVVHGGERRQELLPGPGPGQQEAWSCHCPS